LTSEYNTKKGKAAIKDYLKMVFDTSKKRNSLLQLQESAQKGK